MADASLALQKAMVSALKAGVAGVANRVYDRPPQAVAYPFIRVADGQTVADEAECIAGVEVFFDVHVWSQAVGSVECRTLAGDVRAALHHAELTLDSPWALVELQHRDTRFLSDPDGLTSHAVVTVRALIDLV